MEEQNIPKKSRPWDVNGRFETFEEADARRNDLLDNSSKHDVKVKRLYVGNDNWAFFVKTRLKEEFVKKNEKKKVRRQNRKPRKPTNQRANDFQT